MKVEVDEVQGFSITSLRETTLLTQLNHPNVVNVKEVVVGETLRRFVIDHVVINVLKFNSNPRLA